MNQFELACDISLSIQKNNFEEFKSKIMDLKDIFYLKEIQILCKDLQREEMLLALQKLQNSLFLS